LRPKLCLLARDVRLQRIVTSKLILDWSPEQVSGWLKTQYPDDESMRVSHETIYRSLFIQARGVLKKSLLRTFGPNAAYAGRTTLASLKTHAVKLQMPSPFGKGPPKFEDRAMPGHWEGDLLSGSRNSHMVTLVERHSRFTALVKVPSKDTAVVVAALSLHIRKLSLVTATLVDLG
jgi:IS30 family transposase